MTTRSSVPAMHAGPVGAEDARLGHRGEPPPQPDVETVERGGAQLDEHLAGARHRVGHLLVAQHLGPALLVDADRLHAADRTRARGAIPVDAAVHNVGR